MLDVHVVHVEANVEAEENSRCTCCTGRGKCRGRGKC